MFFKRLFLKRAINFGKRSPIDRVRLLMRLPSILRISYRLMLDSRVSLSSKLMTAGSVALLLSPLDIPAWILPFVGQVGDALVIVNVLDTFIRNAPRLVVEEHLADLGMTGKYRF